MTETYPSTSGDQPKLVIQASFKDASTKALWIHKDLVQVEGPWEEESHLSPMATEERFGDVESWAAYVKLYSPADPDRPAFLTWNAGGLHAVLDYAKTNGEPGRCEWLANHPFLTSAQWSRWMALANGRPIGQRETVEKLEDLGADIREPAPADLMDLLRSLRASIKAQADTELRADGTTSIVFKDDRELKAGAGHVSLPPVIAIAIPVLKGHVDAGGRPVLYRLEVRLRVSVGEEARLAFRFTIPDAERVMEDVFADRVRAADELLGEGFTLLRAAD